VWVQCSGLNEALNMSKRLSYERYLWFHRKLKAGKYPKLRDLMERFELSRRQAAREIENMRLFFNAPVEYSTIEMGYFYSDQTFEFPSAMISEEELISLIIAKRLSVSIPDQRRKNQLSRFFENMSTSFDIDVAALETRISLKNVRYYRVKPNIFDTVLQGLSQGKKIDILYHSVYRKSDTQRIIAPLHLVLYMGNWHIIAYCEARKGIRDFALSRIRQAEYLDQPIESHLKAINIKEQMDRSYGIFFDGPARKVVLKFNASVSEYVQEQEWFPGQSIEEEHQSGDLFLTFYVNDFREVSREIMTFGADVEVLEPKELRDIIKEKIKGLAEKYL
jgi:predicted DNA-binding transcriptional regulator YafY